MDIKPGLRLGVFCFAGDVRSAFDELLLLSQWSLVQEVRRHLKEIRRGYVPRTETLDVVRGRITDRGLVQYAATGVPKLECNFDQFTESTPLARVLVTALEVIVSGALLHDMQVGNWSVAEDLLDEAAQLRRYLGSIPSLPRSVAIETANRIRLTRLQQGWSRSLALAQQILNREPPKMESQQRGESSWTPEMVLPAASSRAVHEG